MEDRYPAPQFVGWRVPQTVGSGAVIVGRMEPGCEALDAAVTGHLDRAEVESVVSSSEHHLGRSDCVVRITAAEALDELGGDEADAEVISGGDTFRLCQQSGPAVHERSQVTESGHAGAAGHLCRRGQRQVDIRGLEDGHVEGVVGRQHSRQAGHDTGRRAIAAPTHPFEVASRGEPRYSHRRRVHIRHVAACMDYEDRPIRAHPIEHRPVQVGAVCEEQGVWPPADQRGPQWCWLSVGYRQRGDDGVRRSACCVEGAVRVMTIERADIGSEAPTLAVSTVRMAIDQSGYEDIPGETVVETVITPARSVLAVAHRQDSSVAHGDMGGSPWGLVEGDDSSRRKDGCRPRARRGQAGLSSRGEPVSFPCWGEPISIAGDPAKKQAARPPAEVFASAGSASKHRSNTSGHRG